MGGDEVTCAGGGLAATWSGCGHGGWTTDGLKVDGMGRRGTMRAACSGSSVCLADASRVSVVRGDGGQRSVVRCAKGHLFLTGR